MASTVDYEIEIMQYKHSRGATAGTTVVTPQSVKGWLPEELRMDATATWEAPFSGGLMGMLPSAVVAGMQAFGVKPASQLLTMQMWQATEAQDITFQLAFYTETDPQKDVRDKVLALMSLVIPSVDDSGFLLAPGPSLDPDKGKDLVDALLKVGEGQLVGTFKAFKGFAERALEIAKDKIGDASKPKTTTDTAKQPVAYTVEKNFAASAKTALANKETLAQAVQNRVSVRFGKFMFLRDVVVINANPTWSTSNLDAETGLPNFATVDLVVRPLFALTAQDLQDMFYVLSKDEVDAAVQLGRNQRQSATAAQSKNDAGAPKQQPGAGSPP